MSTALWMRRCRMNINGRILDGPPMNLEFETTFSTGSSSQTKAKIYNPAPETIAACEKEKTKYPYIIIDAGYIADYGTCVAGEIIKYEVKKGMDEILELDISDKSSLWNYSMINKSWVGPISASSIISQLFRDVGITPGKIDLSEDVLYERGISFSGVSLRTAMLRIARDTKTEFFFKSGLAYFMKPNTTSGTAFFLSYDSGLLEAQKTNNIYKIKSLFLYNLGAGSLVSLEGADIKEKLKVVKGKHTFSTSGNSITEIEGKKI
jgi:hypothetical protein